MDSSSDSPNLDFLRSVAVALVLSSHLIFQLGFRKFGGIGRSGVLLFFVHTSLVLMFSLERLNSKSLHVAIPFCIQRLFRIAPLCWFCIVVVLLFHIPSSPDWSPTYRWEGWQWVVNNLLLVQNFTLTSLVSGPLWSLSYEVQMYLTLPFIYRVASGKNAFSWISAIWLGAAVATSALSRLYGGLFGDYDHDSVHPVLTYFVPCFLAGVFAFILSKRWPANLSFWLLPPALVGFVFSIHKFPIRHTDWIVCTAIGFLLPRLTELRSEFFRRVFHSVAKYSYGIYLSHAPLLWFVFGYFSGLPLFLRISVFLGLVGVVSVACYRWIEKPMIDVGRSLARRLATPKLEGARDLELAHKARA